MTEKATAKQAVVAFVKRKPKTSVLMAIGAYALFNSMFGDTLDEWSAHRAGFETVYERDIAAGLGFDTKAEFSAALEASRFAEAEKKRLEDERLEAERVAADAQPLGEALRFDVQVIDIINSALSYPPVGEIFSISASPCFNKASPEKRTGYDGFYCDQGFDDQIKRYSDRYTNADSPMVRQTFKFLEDGALNSVLTGFHNMFSSPEDAEKFLNDKYGHLGLMRVASNENWFNSDGGPIVKFELGFSERVTSWSRTQFSFGCDLYPSDINPRNEIPRGSPEYGEWEEISYELWGAYPWLTDVKLVSAADFVVNKRSVINSEADRCVAATILYGERERTSLSAPRRSVVEVIIAEINPNFPIIYERFWAN